MGVARMLRPWRAVIQGALPHLHGHQVSGLCEASWAMIQAGDCRLSKMAVATLAGAGSGRAKVPSRERRWQRLVANPRLNAKAAMKAWAAWVLSDARAVTLFADETPQHNRLRVMKVSRMVGGRAVPVVFACYRPDALPMPQGELVLDLLKKTHAALPEGARPTLMADRGLSWPAVVDFCTGHGWRYLLRVQGHTRAEPGGGPEVAVRELAPTPGAGWWGRAKVFKRAGWRETNLVAWWEPSAPEPWFLITDLPAEKRRCKQYRKRMRQEQSFRDEKSSGFRWNGSGIRDPAHATRLLLVMALATAWLIRLGLWLVRTAQRGLLERTDRRTLSLFQLGLRYLHDSLHPSRPPPCFKSVGR